MANTEQGYKYSFGSWAGKLALWIFLSAVITSLLFDFPNSIFDLIQGSGDQNDWLRLGLSLLLIALISSYAVNLYPNVELAGSGLKIDYFWTQKFIPWDGIVDMIQTSNIAYKSWAVEVKKLSLLHQLYGLFYLKSFSRPCFVIFSYLPDHEKLVEKLHKEIKKNKKLSGQ